MKKKKRKVNIDQRRLDLKHPLLGRATVKRLELGSLRLLEQVLKTDRALILELAARADSLYKEFPQPPKKKWFPRLPPSATKVRILVDPDPKLKKIQKQINKLLARVELPGYCFGGVKGKNLLDNVRMHLDAPCLITLDISSFFPSVSAKKVFHVWHRVLGCNPRISRLLTKMTTRKGCLPQGAPTSPAIANLYLMSIDKPIRDYCDGHGLRYSSWIDDLAFSGKNPRAVIPLVVHTLGVHGLRLSRRKIRIMGPGSRKILTGILMNKFPSVVGVRISSIRSGVHKLRTRQVPVDEMSDFVRSLDASIRFIEDVVDGRAVKAVSKLRTEFDELS
jgi:RNA-directed DNA polymerase